MSKRPRRIEWQFALLLLVLLTTMALGPSALLQYVLSAAHIPESTARTLNWSLLALSCGFLFMTGGLGLWAYRSTLEREGERRVGEAVGSIDALRDGLLALDRTGKIIGANAAARGLAVHAKLDGRGILEAFPCLYATDVDLLLRAEQPIEVERMATRDGEARIFRFRVQPGSSGPLLLVGDVTDQAERRRRDQQHARLQLIGRIARGVAHDFNNVLCAVSGHAALLQRIPKGREIDQSSLEAIQRESERGALLARRLLDISRDTQEGVPGDDPAQEVRQSLDLLGAAMRRGWKVRTQLASGLAPISLTSAQIEQIVLSLGIGAISRSGLPEGFLHLVLRPPEGAGFWGEPGFLPSFVLVVFASPLGDDHPEQWRTSSGDEADHEEMGVIESVIRGLVEGVGGRFSVLQGPESRSGYRLSLPCSKRSRDLPVTHRFSHRIRAQATGKRILLGFGDPTRYQALKTVCEGLDMVVVQAGDLTSLMHNIADMDQLVAAVVDHALVRDEAEAFRRILEKLHPGAHCMLLESHGLDLAERDPGELLLRILGSSSTPDRR